MYDIRNLSISSTHPCLVIYLIDQSGSMDEVFGNTRRSIAEETAKAVNEIIWEIGQRSTSGLGEPKNRFELSVIGYGKRVQSGWEGNLSGKWVVGIKEVFEKPVGVINDIPVWINPYSDGGTPMTRAFENARRICEDWISWGNHMDCHPPIIINITDGEPTDAGYNHSDLKREIEHIKTLGTHYGGVNILNIHLTPNESDRILFPTQPIKAGGNASLLYEISTHLNDSMIQIAQSKGYNVQPGAKGYVYNGNGGDLISFLNIGTPQ